MVRVRTEAQVGWKAGDSESRMLKFGLISVGSVVGIFEEGVLGCSGCFQMDEGWFLGWKRLWNGGKGCWDSSEIGEGIGSGFLGVGGFGPEGKEEEGEGCFRGGRKRGI